SVYPLGINTTAAYTGAYYLKLEGQGGRFGYSVSLSKSSINCGAGPCPDLIASGQLGWGASVNSLGEVVWSQFDQATQKNQLYSSQRGQLTFDAVDHNSPAINNLGDLVWTEFGFINDINTYTLKGIIAGQPVTLATSTIWIGKADINDHGEVVWNQGDQMGSHLFSNLRGQLTSDSSSHNDPAINNQGDIVFTQPDPVMAGPNQVYKLTAGSSTPVAITNDSFEHRSPTINDNGEIVWIEREMYSPTALTRISGTNGTLFTSTADLYSVDRNNCGDIVYVANENGQYKLFRLGGSVACITPPQREFALKVNLISNGLGAGTVATLPA